MECLARRELGDYWVYIMVCNQFVCCSCIVVFFCFLFSFVFSCFFFLHARILSVMTCLGLADVVLCPIIANYKLVAVVALLLAFVFSFFFFLHARILSVMTCLGLAGRCSPRLGGLCTVRTVSFRVLSVSSY